MTSTFDTGVRTVRTIARAQAWFSRRARAFGALFVLCAMVMLPGISHASGCLAYSPINITVGSGQTYTIDLTANYGDCAYYGTTLTQTTSAHGTISNSNTNPAAHIYVYYTNNGDGATSDAFSFQDDVGNNIQVNVTILPAASAISITPTSFSFTGGTAVNTSFSASGGTGSYSYSVTAGTLPAGLSLSTVGALTGTPSAYGPYSFTVTATDSSSTPQSGTQSYTGSVAPGNLTISPASPLTNATITIPYSVSLSGNNGIAPYSFAITDPANLPPGISLSGNTLSGTPTVAGTYNFHIAVTDSETDASGASSSNTVVLPYQLVIQTAPTITITPTTLSNGTAGTAYTSTNFTASGGTSSYTYSISTGSLPAGMSLSTAGTLSGTPTAAGTFNFTVQAKDANNFTGTQAIALTVDAPAITVTPTTVANATVGAAYTPVNFTASGGAASYSYSVSAGSLPAGMSLSTAGTLSGTPTAAGTFNFTVQAKDANNFTGTQAITLTVDAPAITITPTSLSNGTAGTAYTSTNFTASGGTGSYTYSVSAGSLPAGMSLSSGGTLSGTPTAAGTFNFTVQAKDTNNVTGTQAISLTVDAPTITVSPNTVSNATVGVAYTPASFTASGGAAAYTYSVSAGSLPAGMNLSSGGTLSGTPTAAGTFNFTVQAKDANNFTGTTSSISMTVNAPTITVGPGAISNMQVGVPYSQQFIASGGTQGSGYTFAASGTVPAGLSLSSSGLLSGTPTSATSSASFTVTATDQSTGTGAPFSGSQGYTVSVAAPTLSISPVSGTTLTAATQNSSYSQPFTASGGTPNYNYQITGGTLPNGLSLSNGGQLSGTPTEAGTFNFTVTATDSSTGTGSPFTVSGSYTLDVQPIVPVANPVTINVPYSSTANVVSTSFSGGTPTSVAVASPASHGTATASGTTITYTPTAGYTGPDSFTYTGTNSAGTSAPATVSITVSAPTLAITSSSGGTSLTATVGQSFTQTFTFSGGKAPYQGYSITGIPAGLSVTGFNNTSITISGTPTVSGSFTLGVSGTDSSTGTDPSSGANAPFTVNQTFSLQISPAAMSVSPASGTLPGATVGAAYSQSITASGGISPYSYAVTSGSLPAGLTVTPVGMVQGTPSAGGVFTFTVTATDSSTGAGSPATASATYNLTVAAPAITLTPGTLPGAQQGTAYSQQLTASGGTATYTYQVTSGNLPTGMTLSSTGLISGTPTVVNTYNFTVTATDSSTGTGSPYTGSQSYSLAVALGAPVANADTATTPSQSAVTIPVTSNDTGTIDSIAIASAPSNGTATVSGTSVVYTPTGTFFGTDTFSYTATNSAGTSAAATVTVTVKPLPAPTVTNQSMRVLGGQTVTIDPTVGATGGPYTAVAIASAPGVGTATVSGLKISYKAPATASGTDTFTYTLSNAYGTSKPATVTLTLIPRPDPTKDAEVMGVLRAQAQSTRRFMRGQIDNFQSRLENLHDGGSASTFQNNLSVTFGGGRRGMLHGPAALADPDMSMDGLDGSGGHTLSARTLSGAEAQAPQGETDAHGFTLWASGALNFGTQRVGTSYNGIDFNTSGLTLGADTHVSDRLALGGGIGYGHDASDVGKNGSRSTADAYSVAGYASYRPSETTFVDGVLGYQWLSFDARRYVTVDGNFVHGSRNGSQVFGSLSAGFDHRRGNMRLSPYGRIDAARAQLDAYTEQGDALYALRYDPQTIQTTTGALGLRLDWSLKRDFGVLRPMLRVEYRHDFQGTSATTMRYADMIGPLYRSSVGVQSRNHTLLGVGLETQNDNGLRLRIEYQNMFESSTSSNQSVLLHLEKSFR